jgi:uncharacterized protein YlxW (UPF0749 family)
VSAFNNDLDLLAEVVSLRQQVFNLQQQVDAMRAVFDRIAPAEEQLRESTDVIFDWANIEDLKL